SFAPFESLIFTSIIVPQASSIGHLSGIITSHFQLSSLSYKPPKQR
ncbi:unnamed protein product, partial [Musa textilis]